MGPRASSAGSTCGEMPPHLGQVAAAQPRRRLAQPLAEPPLPKRWLVADQDPGQQALHLLARDQHIAQDRRQRLCRQQGDGRRRVDAGATGCRSRAGSAASSSSKANASGPATSCTELSVRAAAATARSARSSTWAGWIPYRPSPGIRNTGRWRSSQAMELTRIGSSPNRTAGRRIAQLGPAARSAPSTSPLPA